MGNRRGGPQNSAWLTIAIGLVVTLAGVSPVQASPTPEPGTVWTVETHVNATVVDNYATVDVTVVIGNEGPDPEFPFEVTVPDDAFITGLTIERDGTVYNATVEDRETARQTYDEAKAQGKTAGLVEKHRRSSTYSYLINVEAFETVRATLTYERYLAADEGVYTLPLTAPVTGFGQDQGATFDVTLEHTDGITAAWSEPSSRVSESGEGMSLHHEVGPRQDEAATPLDVHYTVSPTDEDGSVITSIQNGTGYFAHRFRAPADAVKMPLDMTLVLDTSGSMSGLKIDQLRDAASQVVSSLDDGDRLNLVFFSSDVRVPWPGLQPADVNRTQAAIDEVQRSNAAGSTNIEAAIQQGFAGYGDNGSQERVPILVFLTDGRPTMGEERPTRLRELARAANQVDAHVFSLAFGGDADWGLVHGLAADADGTALRVPSGQGAEVDLRRFMAALTTPVLKDVEISYDGQIEALNRSAPVLFAGSELLVVGTFDPDLTELAGTVSAQTTDGPRTYTFNETVGEDQASFLPRLVAYHRIMDQQERIDAYGANSDWVENVTELALTHGFVTDYTSLVLELPKTDLGEAHEHHEGAEDGADGADHGASHGSSGGASSGDMAYDRQRSTSGGAPATTDPAAGSPSPPARSDDPAPAPPADRNAKQLDEEHRQLYNQPEAEAPGPGVALVLASLAGLALVAARRRR